MAPSSKVVGYLALCLLVAQNTALVLLLRLSRTASEGPQYIASTAVASMECVKFVTCVLVLFAGEKWDPRRFATLIRQHLFGQPRELAKLAVPSLLYTVQNNLLYFALSHLEAAPYQVCYQLKILTTALFSVVMLRRRLTRLKWVSLAVLTAGVALAQLSKAGPTSSGGDELDVDASGRFLGLCAVIAASVTSGFSGVYFEKILKGSRTTLWMRNIQMGTASIVLGMVGVLVKDYAVVAEKGFFYGYNRLTVAVILLQALGGLTVAVVVKYADNILKGFAASFSIVTSCIIEYFFFDFHPTPSFFAGALLVNVSMYLYGRPAKKFKRGGSPSSDGDGDDEPLLPTHKSLDQDERKE